MAWLIGSTSYLKGLLFPCNERQMVSAVVKPVVFQEVTNPKMVWRSVASKLTCAPHILLSLCVFLLDRSTDTLDSGNDGVGRVHMLQQGRYCL